GTLLTAPDFDLAGPMEPAQLSTRVLVALRTDNIPAVVGAEASWTHLAGDIYSVRLPITALEELASHDNVEYVEAERTLSPTLDSSLPETRADRVHNPLDGDERFTGNGVLLGIIDFGLDFTLDDFRRPDGATRVAFLWDQFLNPEAGEASPQGFGYGVEYDEATINQALNAADPFTIVRHRPQFASHGTHVAGIAAGNGRTADPDFPAGQFVGAAPEATIIFVQPNSRDQDSTFTDSVHVSEAVKYIFDKAVEMDMPCVINMSLGQNGGSHDAESLVERAIDRQLERSGRAFIVAAGNEHVWRGHAGGALAEGDSRTLRWRCGGGLPWPGIGVLPLGLGDFTPNEMEIWYSSRDSIRVTVTDPQGNSTTSVDPGNTILETLAGGDQVFIDSQRFSPLNGDAQIYIEVSPGPAGTVTRGVWVVEIEALVARNGRFDAWIERDARRVQNNFADQSFFVGNDFDGQMTLGTPATTRRGVAVANYDHVVQAPNDSSSRGRTRDGRAKPEVAAPGTDIFASSALGGKRNPDFDPGNPTTGPEFFPVRVRKTGTSMSAPHVAGIVALMLEKERDLTAPQIKAMLAAAASSPPGVVPFDMAWGFGRVDARSTIDLV
ncbi:MAG: S8 family peptidase, partial [Candidatus Promineifilaceae bacterium]|nr:S8 family peptidase [Candidatus Promineifilaceae bacterium]